MKVSVITLRVVLEDHPRKDTLSRWNGPKLLRNHIAKCGGLKFTGRAMAVAKRTAFKIAQHPLVRTVRIIRRVETELWMIDKNGYQFAITKDQAGVLG